MSKEIIFKAVLEDGEFKAKLEGIEASADKADEGVRSFEQSTRSLGQQLKTGAGLSEFNKGAQEVTNTLKAQDAVVKQIEADIKALNKQLENTAPGKAQQTLQKEVNAANRVLKEEVAILKGLQSETDKVAAKKVNLTTRARQLKNELVALELAGKRDTDQFRALSIEAAKLNDAIGDVSQRTKALASDTASFDAFAQGIQGIAGGFAAAQGAAALFGSENEDVQKALLKVQATLAIVNGLQAVFATLNKDSAFLTIANAKATGVATAAMRLFGVSVNTTSTAFKVLRGAIIGLGIGAIVAVIGALASKFESVSENADNASKSVSDLTKELEDLRKKSKELQAEAINSIIDLQVAQLGLTKQRGFELKTLRDTDKALEDITKTSVQLKNEVIKGSDEVIKKLEEEIAIRKANLGGSTAFEAENKSIQKLEAQKTFLATQRAEKIAQIDADSAKQRELVELIATNRIETNKIEERNKGAKKANNEKQKIEESALKEFEKLFLASIETQLSEEEKLINENKVKRLKLEETFNNLSASEKLAQQEKLNKQILILEATLNKELENLNNARIEREIELRKKQEEKIKKLRLDGVNERILGVENDIFEIQLKAGDNIQKQINSTDQLIDKERERYAFVLSQLELEGASKETRRQAELDFYATINALEQNRVNLVLQNNEEIFNQFIQLYGQIFALQSNLNQQRIQQIQDEKNAELEAFEGTEEQKARIEERFAAKEKAAKQKAAQDDKNAAIFEATINGIAAIIKAGGLFSPIGILTAASVALQIAAIQSQPLPRFEKGGMVSGKSHRQGGTLIEAEKGEYIINKKSTSKHKDLLNAINTSDAKVNDLIFKKFVLPEIAGLSKQQNILVNASLKSDKMESEIRKSRKQEMQNTMVIAKILKNNSSLSNRYKWQ